MRLHFEDVGRRKASFFVIADDLKDERIKRALRKHGGLMSSDICLLTQSKGEGELFRGFVTAGFHVVGKFRRVEDPAT